MKAQCVTCRTVVDMRVVDDEGRCQSCQAQLELPISCIGSAGCIP